MKANTNDNILNIFGNNIKQFREVKKCTQYKLLEETSDLDEKTLRNIENGKQEASYGTLIKLMNCLQKIDTNITLSKLLGVN